MEGRNMAFRDREKLVEHLGFAETLNQDVPLLSEIIKLSKVSILRSETPTPTSESQKLSFRNDEDLSIQSQSEKSSVSLKTPEVVTKTPNRNDFNSTFTLNSNTSDK